MTVATRLGIRRLVPPARVAGKGVRVTRASASSLFSPFRHRCYCHDTSASRLQRPSFQPSTQTRIFGRGMHVTVKVPPMAESISEGTLTAFTKRKGDHVDEDEVIATIETDNIDVSVSAPQAGRVAEILVAEGDTVLVAQKVALIKPDTLDEHEKHDQGRKSVWSTRTAVDDIVKASPEESSLMDSQPDSSRMSNVPPTKQTRIAPSQQEDTGVTASEQNVRDPAKSVGSTPRLLVEQGGGQRNVRKAQMPRIRRTIAQRLKQSQEMTASLTAVREVDMTALINWRKRHKDTVSKSHGLRLGYMGAFVRAATLAAQEVPAVNSAMDQATEEIIFRDYVDISIAVSTPKGLVTPVLRGCQSMTILDIEREVAALAEKARSGKLVFENLQGGNFSISNPGIFGSMFGTPVINYPQAAVFNMNAISERVVVAAGKVEIRPMMYITLAYDHRLIEDREAVLFLHAVKTHIEDPSCMLLS